MSSRTNAQTMRFHEIHGKNIELKCDRTKAFRKINVEEKGLNNIVFTQKPVVMLHPTVFKMTKTDDFSYFTLSIGLTLNDPYDIQENMTGHSDYDTASGFWTRLLIRSNEKRHVFVISFYVEQSGKAYYTINDEEEGFLMNEIDTSRKLWAFIEISSYVKEIEWVGNQMAPCLHVEISPPKKIKSQITSFHWMHGQDICLKKDKTTACRSKDPGYYAYAFTNRPFELSEKVVFSVNKLRKSSTGLFEYGITSNDPSKIAPNDLPKSTDDLLLFSNDWVIYKDKHTYNVGDIITFIITRQGKFKVFKNFNSKTCILQIEITQPLWLFVKLCGSVSELSIKNWSTKEYCKMIEENQFIVSSGSDLCSYGSTAMVNSTESTECLLCCEKTNDCVLYRCGHLCMCYECAESAWRRKDIVLCPICRAYIQDIFKIGS